MDVQWKILPDFSGLPASAVSLRAIQTQVLKSDFFRSARNQLGKRVGVAFPPQGGIL
jgi:hypothetical protein